MMDTFLQDAGDFAAAYLDDVIIYSNTLQEYLDHVSTVLQLLGNAGLTIKPKKCQFAMITCEYLGHVVGNGEICPGPAKLAAFQNFPTPKTKKQV